MYNRGRTSFFKEWNLAFFLMAAVCQLAARTILHLISTIEVGVKSASRAKTDEAKAAPPHTNAGKSFAAFKPILSLHLRQLPEPSPKSFIFQSTKRETNLTIVDSTSSVQDIIMSDTKPTTGEASNNPAEAVAQTETAAQAPVEKSSDEKPVVADTTTDSVSKDVAAGPKSEGKKDTADAVKSEESSAKPDAKDVRKEENGNDKKRSYDRKDDRNGKFDRNDRGDRGDKRRGGRNDKFPRNKKPRYEASFS